MSENTIYILLAVAIILVLIIAFVIYRMRNTPGIQKSLENKIDSMTTNMPSYNNPTTPSMYGAQNVVQGTDGIWRLAPGTCELFVTGIVDWSIIKSMSDAQKQQLFDDLGNCKGENIPLLQP